MNIKNMSAQGGKKIKNVCLSVKQGSVLAYSLIILSMMLAVAVAISAAVIIEKKNASVNEHSAQAIQTSDSGLQYALSKINKSIINGDGLSYIKSVFPNCDNLAYDDNFVADGPHYKLTFYTDSACQSKVQDCTIAPLVGTLGGVKGIACVGSVGTYMGTVRAANMAVAANYTKLLLHMDESDNTFKDSSTSNKTITINGGVLHDSDTMFSSGKSAEFSGANYLSAPASSDFNLSKVPFTIDTWINFSDISKKDQTIFNVSSSSSKALRLVFNSSSNAGVLCLYASSNGSSWDITSPQCVQGKKNDFAAGTWYHVAVVHDTSTSSPTYKVYAGGKEDIAVSSSSNLPDDDNNTVKIGYSGGGSEYFYGNMDEFIVSKGIARWTSEFDTKLPNSPYTN